MKIYISADIEGVAGVTQVDETNADHAHFAPFAEQMSREVAAACEGAVAAGATYILVKDAHWTARNIIASMLPREAELIRGWSGHPGGMTDGLVEGFDASLFVGYHAKAGTGGNPLAHTISGGDIQTLRINGELASEFRVASFSSNMVGVPTAFLSGDAAICADAESLYPGMATFATFKGKGRSTQSVHPDISVESIRSGVEEILRSDVQALAKPNPELFKVEIEYKRAPEAYYRSFYPGATFKEERIVCFETNDWFEVLRFFSFVI